MSEDAEKGAELPPGQEPASDACTDHFCPVCGAKLLQEKCKVVCRSERCTYRIIMTCAEF